MGWRKTFKILKRSYANATEMVRLGRLTDPHRTPFEVVHSDRIYNLRRYQGVERLEAGADASPILLIPPLMVTSEIYDMSPDVSAASYLLGQGLDVWMVDFGSPERVEGGMARTLDDHVRAVSGAIDRVVEATGHDVHVAGYSQGGMFCYQAAAYRRSEGVASVITFGSPVDIYRNLPVPVSEEMAEKMIGGLRQVIERPLAQLDGLPGFLTSFGFKMVSPKKEAQQLVEFVRKLHDRSALEKRESRRRFLGGEGFVAWPGPALRTFVDEFIVANRLASGGFVIDGRSVSLADLTCPILYFVGLRDDIARPASVRAIKSAAFNADSHELGVRAGHLGLVVGTRALTEVWPTVTAWMGYVDHGAELPERLRPVEDPRIDDVDDAAFDDLDLDVEDFYGFATDALEDVVGRLGRAGEDLTGAIDALRWQLPRLTRLRKIRAETRISSGLALAEKAREMPDATFFLWKGRAFSYADADRRVDAIVRGLVECGVTPGQRVGVLMQQRPTYLSIVTALNRLGAVAVLVSPEMSRLALERALASAEVEHLVADPAHVARAREVFAGPVLALGGPYGDDRALPEGVRDMEAIDVARVVLPKWYEPDPGRASDEAMILFTAGRAEEPRAARITNRRWAFSALGAAAGCTLNPNDTVFCVLPLHHAAGILVATGGALIGGSRLALASGFAPAHFWSEARRYGATVVFYAGEMCRELVDAPPNAADDNNPVRIFAGSGMRRDVWERLQQRFKVGVLEFYASTEGNAVLANAAGRKVGALGQPLPGATDMSIVAWDFRNDDFVRDEQGFLQRCGVDRPGMLIARVDRGHPMAGFDGYVGNAGPDRVAKDVFEAGDRWFVSGDLLRQDADGELWFVDRLADVVRTDAGPVFTREVEDLIYRRPDVKMVAVHAWSDDRPAEVCATLVARGDSLDVGRLASLLDEKLEPRARPRYLRVVDAIAVTDGYRPLKRPLVDAREQGAREVWERVDGRYERRAPTRAAEVTAS
ncbi:MAG: alpha/beta fold hydrolase [Sandaracinaceae bacterium]|nr:alpha/beta fold hydrolase [Sandaracinaceae bacterium]